MAENCLSGLHIHQSFFSSLKSVIAFLLAPKIYRILNSQRNVKHGHLESAPRTHRSAPVHQFHTWYFPHSIFWCTNAPHWCTGALHQCTSAQVRCTSALTYKGEFQTRSIISRVALWIYPASKVLNMGKTGAERLRESCERKKQKKKESNARFYWKNKDRILEDRKEQRRRKR